jgi:hypothetical protein
MKNIPYLVKKKPPLATTGSRLIPVLHHQHQKKMYFQLFSTPNQAYSTHTPMQAKLTNIWAEAMFTKWEKSVELHKK